jgi:glucokinase
VAVDIGATKTVIAVYEGTVMSEIARFPTGRHPEDEVTRIVETIRKEPRASAATAVGIGAPGPLDPVAGRILAPPNLVGWRDFPLVDELVSRLGKTTRLENDANLGALGEAVHGSGAGYRSMYYVTISTGIGAGFVIDGKIFGGHRGIAGEVFAVEPGHFNGMPGGDNLNELASGPGLVRRAKRLSSHDGNFDTPELFAAVDAGDALAVGILEDGRNAIVGLLTTVLFSVAPDAIVLAGGLCTENRWFVEPVRDRVRTWVNIPELAEVPIERAKLWDRAVLYGAAELVT